MRLCRYVGWMAVMTLHVSDGACVQFVQLFLASGDSDG